MFSLVWWCVSLVPRLGKQRQEALCEVEDSLVYIERLRTSRDMWRDTVSKSIATTITTKIKMSKWTSLCLLFLSCTIFLFQHEGCLVLLHQNAADKFVKNRNPVFFSFEGLEVYDLGAYI